MFSGLSRMFATGGGHRIRRIETTRLHRIFWRSWNGLLCVLLCMVAAGCTRAANSSPVPTGGTTTLTILSPNLLELDLVTVKEPDPARVPQWDFVDDKFQFVAPDVSQI